MHHPDQPIQDDGKGVLRFKENKIISLLLRPDGSRLDLNDIAVMRARGTVSQEDYDQLNQLIGYSVSGYLELSLVSDEAKDRAEKAYYLAVEEEKHEGAEPDRPEDQT